MRILNRLVASTSLVVVLVVGGCGGEDTPNSGTGSSASTSTTRAQVPSAAQLAEWVVSPPAPFEQQSDDVLETGLMEPGNAESGTIGIGYAQEDELVAAGFIRGWEKYFRAPDEAAVVGHVFVFDSDEGPLAMVERFDMLDEPGFERFTVAGVPGGIGFSGTSPEGRSANVGAAAHGRFLIGFTVGGQPGGHDYADLLVSLMRQQIAALPEP